MQDYKTALMAASRSGHIEIVKALVEAGADVSIKTKVDCMPERIRMIAWYL